MKNIIKKLERAVLESVPLLEKVELTTGMTSGGLRDINFQNNIKV